MGGNGTSIPQSYHPRPPHDSPLCSYPAEPASPGRARRTGDRHPLPTVDLQPAQVPRPMTPQARLSMTPHHSSRRWGTSGESHFSPTLPKNKSPLPSQIFATNSPSVPLSKHSTRPA
jgi:hypothetical protein